VSNKKACNLLSSRETITFSNRALIGGMSYFLNNTSETILVDYKSSKDVFVVI
jgi:hypothetical protein